MHLLNCNIILAEHLFPDKSYVNNIYKDVTIERTLYFTSEFKFHK